MNSTECASSLGSNERINAKPSVLFVDDEERVLKAMRGLFRRDFELFLMTDGEKAVRAVREHDIDVLVADQRMPGMTGVEVLQQVKAVSPRTVRILLTGYADLDAIEASINESEVFRFLSKPCPPDLLRETLMQAIKTAQATVDTAIAKSISSSNETTGKISPRVTTPQHGKVLPFPDAVSVSSDACKVPQVDNVVITDEIILSGDTAEHSTTQILSESDRCQNIGVAVFTKDATFAESSMRALQKHYEASLASTLVAVTKILEEKRAGVLVTDFTDDVILLRNMIGTLKRYLPELITIVASENRDASDMIALINYGQVFRYIPKPLNMERVMNDVGAAAIKHRQLLEHPELVQRHAVLESPNASSETSRLLQFADHLKGIRAHWR